MSHVCKNSITHVPADVPQKSTSTSLKPNSLKLNCGCSVWLKMFHWTKGCEILFVWFKDNINQTNLWWVVEIPWFSGTDLPGNHSSTRLQRHARWCLGKLCSSMFHNKHLSFIWSISNHLFHNKPYCHNKHSRWFIGVIVCKVCMYWLNLLWVYITLYYNVQSICSRLQWFWSHGSTCQVNSHLLQIVTEGQLLIFLETWTCEVRASACSAYYTCCRRFVTWKNCRFLV